MAVTITNRNYSVPYKLIADASVTSDGGTFYVGFTPIAGQCVPKNDDEVFDHNPVFRVSGGVCVLEQCVHSQSYVVTVHGHA